MSVVILKGNDQKASLVKLLRRQKEKNLNVVVQWADTRRCHIKADQDR